MIYLIEGILPDCYFTNNLRGLSVDMAVFRDLLKLRLPRLSKHLDDLQRDARDSTSGMESYEYRHLEIGTPRYSCQQQQQLM